MPSTSSRSHTVTRSRTNDSKKAQPFPWRGCVCAVLFFALVLVKLFLPNQFAVIQTPVNQLLSDNNDVQAVFASVGQVLAEESDSPLTVVQEILSQFPSTSCEELPVNVCMEQQLLGFSYCCPVGGTISSPFGYREHPTESGERFHYGVDIAADGGTPILCFADGTVTVVAKSSSYGNYLIIDHSNDIRTLYAHCQSISATVGQSVKMGDTIACVGQSGQATGNHLHFEVQQQDSYLNPIYYVENEA